ncbi:EF-hand domain-containing protein [uncultured Gimesia sp.]|uniref:EF-hand domain-containing protein n=1 Tax=uncultured Gimesia sp. TaxID=1678688 RepID=UPI0030D744E5
MNFSSFPSVRFEVNYRTLCCCFYPILLLILTATPTAAADTIDEQFQKLDTNADASLTLAEFMEAKSFSKPELARQAFTVSDFDRNGKLTLAEFQTVNGITTPANRGAVPDPVALFAEAAKRKWTVIQKAADASQDGQLSQAEWPTVELKQQLPPLADLKFAVWDQDQNGQVTTEEAELLLDIAYGMKHSDGSLLRADNGWVVYRSYLTRTDKNNDNQLSKAEYLPSIRWPEEKVLALFEELDVDQNDSLSVSELTKSTTSYIDEVTFFLRSDKDFDGFLSREELLKIGLNSASEARLNHAFPAFDQDGDGKFSLSEFRLAPVGCFYVTLRMYNQKDQDHDARLSWQEFYTEPAPQLIGLVWELFTRFDRDKSGQLELNEYEFQIDMSQIKPEHAFTAYDKNNDGQLTWEEHLPQVASVKPQLAKRNFQVVDFDGNGTLSLQEYQTLPDLFAPRDRGTIPDPFADLAQAAHRAWENIQQAADTNADGQITKNEWPDSALQKQIPSLAKLDFSSWDANRDGFVSSAEASLLIDIAYGMKHVDGFPLRASNGKVLYRFYIERTDKDGDHRLSQAEYLPSIRLPAEQVLKNFQQMDADQDGFLTYREMSTASSTNIDEFNLFLSRDRNLDGFLDAEELGKINSNDSTKGRLPQGMAEFDDNSDGKLSLREFRLAPIGSSYITLRVFDREEQEHDASLTWQEFYAEPSPQLIGIAWEMFQRYDRNQNGLLEPDEFEFQTDFSKMKPTAAFAMNDLDRDGSLTEKEYLAKVAPASTAAARRDFHLVDFDQNGKLSKQEYRALPDLLPIEQRGPVPDPVADLAATAQRTWQQIFKTADSNSDGQLTYWEWPDDELEQKLPPLSKVAFRVWDADQNGKVNRKEADRLIEIAYGMRHITGAPLRSSNGRVMYHSYISHADKDGDHQLSVNEFLRSIHKPPQEVFTIFRELDTDQSQNLSYRELAKSPLSNIDELKFFQRSDTSLDGRLSKEELAKVNSNDSTKERVPQGMAAFDSDGDGYFSLQEFRLSPMGCNYVTMRVYGRQDEDHDGQISWEEFYLEESPPLIGLAWELFQRFDRNQNGWLEFEEIEFRYDATRIPADKYFTVIDLDQNKAISFSEIFSEEKPEESNVVKSRDYEIRYTQADRHFQQSDRNQDQLLDREEYQLFHQAEQQAAEQLRRDKGLAPADNITWLFPLIVSLNGVLLLGVISFVVRRKFSR